MKRVLLWFACLLSLFALAACAIFEAEAPQPIDTLPNLVVLSTRSTLMPMNCLSSYSKSGVIVYVANEGGMDAGPFDVDMNGLVQTVPELKAGASTNLFFDNIDRVWTSIHVMVDSTSQITESSEADNTGENYMATMTPPVPCTATPYGG